MKNLKDRVVSILLVVVVIGSSYGFRVVDTDMITEIYAKEISGVSENDAESVEDDNETMDTGSVVEDTDIDADEQLVNVEAIEDLDIYGTFNIREDIPVFVHRKKIPNFRINDSLNLAVFHKRNGCLTVCDLR